MLICHLNFKDTVQKKKIGRLGNHSELCSYRVNGISKSLLAIAALVCFSRYHLVVVTWMTGLNSFSHTAIDVLKHSFQRKSQVL